MAQQDLALSCTWVSLSTLNLELCSIVKQAPGTRKIGVDLTQGLPLIKIIQVELGDDDDDDQDRDGRNNLEQVELLTVVKLVGVCEMVPLAPCIILEADS